jgi:CRISPR-associated protein Cas2
MQRDLYLVAYDVRDPARLRRVRREVAGYATGGQKSARECLLSARDRDDLVGRLRRALDPALDRAHLVRLRRDVTVWTLGRAVPPHTGPFCFVGEER